MLLPQSQWYVVLESVELGRKPLGVQRLGRRLVFWRGADGTLDQDRRVVVRQTPANSLDALDDRFIEADRGILQFRRQLARLLLRKDPDPDG